MEKSLKVHKKRAEEIRKILIKKNLIDYSRKIISNGEFVYIPILREVNEEELKSLAPIELINIELPLSKKKFKNIMEALDGILPPYLLTLVPSSFDIVGDIAILEKLEPELIPYKKEIAEAIMKVHTNVKTVLLKTGKVEGIFRIPNYELIGGIEKYKTIHKEYGIKLKVDLSKAYYSPRLATEHNRVALQVKDGEIVIDMFAGVGPFSIMIAQRVKAKIYAIDINPNAVELIKENIRINKLKGEIIPLCGDVRNFSNILMNIANRVIMNLPGEAISYLDCAMKFLKKEGGIVHLYAFSKEEDFEKFNNDLSLKLSSLTEYYKILNFKEVRPVAPREWQIVIDFFAKPIQ
ncbi:MAG: class I SAM-dependent methyltransferase family protein [Candidatus Methanomethylicaceae archaeon]